MHSFQILLSIAGELSLTHYFSLISESIIIIHKMPKTICVYATFLLQKVGLSWVRDVIRSQIYRNR